ncbi:MAG: DUF1667 domain-containing protein [Spirochaetes bacterium]|nr:DUF1667 domain-containing protein [Spirochaetota bacterium]MBU0955687.1 DUF1667 domain-containing protein [Spirochaetota bacterium]
MSEHKAFTCIICPRGCRLVVEVQDGTAVVSGNACERGEVYGRQEAIMPLRSLTTTVRTSCAKRPRLPVHSSADLPLARLLEAMEALDEVVVEISLKCGEVVVTNLLQLGVDMLASDDFDCREGSANE